MNRQIDNGDEFDRNTDIKTGRTLADFLFWLAVGVVIGLVVSSIMGCGPAADVEGSSPNGATPVIAVDGGAASTSAPGGQLPIGYYQRQCQWDACGGPLPNLPVQAVDPVER